MAEIHEHTAAADEPSHIKIRGGSAAKKEELELGYTKDYTEREPHVLWNLDELRKWSLQALLSLSLPSYSCTSVTGLPMEMVAPAPLGISGDHFCARLVHSWCFRRTH